MNSLIFLFIILVNFSTVFGEEKNYTGSTPADITVRSFLGIYSTDSIDFIRWQLTLLDNSYTLNCNYGIGKPNTNGFIDGGKKIEIKGALKKEKNNYELNYASKKLTLAELNTDLLHILNEHNNLLVGNAGWSYTLNALKPIHTTQFNIPTTLTSFKDSLVYEGRSPCDVPGIIPAGKLCYKLKWQITFYHDAGSNITGKYKLFGTPYRKAGGRTGTWKIVTNNGRITYQVTDEKGNVLLYLLKADEKIMLFTEANGALLVGNEDFSYMLNCITNS
jgi:hypothetical protein